MFDTLRAFNRVMLVVIAGVLLYIGVGWPVLNGYHVGYNAATDRVCTSRVIQWCK